MTATAKKTCTNKGCGVSFVESENADDACWHHVGAPIFHEGAKGWQCCSKRVYSFDEFLAIPGCTRGRHSDAVVAAPEATATASTSNATAKPTTTTASGVEVYGTASAAAVPAKPAAPAPVVAKKSSTVVLPALIECDPAGVTVEVGAKCKRNGCGYAFKSDEVSRAKGGAEATCNFHAGAPVFHEGSKGWSCCARKVLEFEEFLKIPGCKSGSHMFVGGAHETEDGRQVSAEEAAVAQQPVDDGMAKCRHDWYQTPSHIMVSIYAKKVDPATVKIDFQEKHMTIDFDMPDGKKYNMDIDLFQSIDSEASKFKVMGTKLELSLKKANGISWATLEHTENVTTWTTFGLQGTKGTVGGKEMHISGDAPLVALNR